MDEKKKRNLKKKALEGAAAETIQRYGEAVKEHVVAYTGKDNEIEKELTRSLKSISKSKTNPQYKDINIKQQAGFSAEVKSVAKENAEHIIKGDIKRVSRTDDVNQQSYGKNMKVGGTNDEYYDIAEIDSNGIVVEGSARQVKFVGGTADECAKKLLEKKYDKYRDNDVCIEVPKDFYDKVVKDFKEREEKLEIQIERARKDGDEALAKKHEQRLEKIKKTRKNLRKSNVNNNEAIRARLHPKLETAKEIVKLSNRAGLHQAAIGGAMAGGMSIIKNVVACLKDEKDPQEAAKDVAKDTGIAAAGSYATAFSGSVIKGIMQNSTGTYVRELAHTSIPLMLVSSAKTIGELSISFFKGEITGPEYAESLLQHGVNELGSGMFNTLFMGAVGGAKSTAIKVVAGTVGSTVGYLAAVALYEEVKGAIEEYQIAVEKRKQIEAQCAEAVELICQYREEMNKRVEKCFSEHLTVLNEGFMAMDKAIVDGDVNGFISGNVRIQEFLGHEIQSRNEEEFEDLMLSDEGFKL